MRVCDPLLILFLCACSSNADSSPVSTDPACPATDGGAAGGAVQLQTGSWQECWYGGTRLDFVNPKTLADENGHVTLKGVASDTSTWEGTFDATDGSIRLTSKDGYLDGFSGVITGLVGASGTRITAHRDTVDSAGKVTATTQEIFFKADGQTSCPDHP